MKALAFGIGVGIAVQAWRNFPADGPVSTDMAALVTLLGIIAAYLGGRARRGVSATAVAVASAEASASATSQQAVQVFIGGEQGPRARHSAIRIPDEEVGWLRGVEDRPELSLDQLDGMDLSEFSESYEHQEGP